MVCFSRDCGPACTSYYARQANALHRMPDVVLQYVTASIQAPRADKLAVHPQPQCFAFDLRCHGLPARAVRLSDGKRRSHDGCGPCAQYQIDTQNVHERHEPLGYVRLRQFGCLAKCFEQCRKLLCGTYCEFVHLRSFQNQEHTVRCITVLQAIICILRIQNNGCITPDSVPTTASTYPHPYRAAQPCLPPDLRRSGRR